MNRAMTKNLTHTRMIIIKLKTLLGGNLHHGAPIAINDFIEGVYLTLFESKIKFVIV